MPDVNHVLLSFSTTFIISLPCSLSLSHPSADYHRLRVGGLILAAVLCLIGFTILLSELNS